MSEQIYIDALEDLAKQARMFSDAMLRAAGAAMLVDPRGKRQDHPRAVALYQECQEALLTGFAKAPGMAQLFFPKEEL